MKKTATPSNSIAATEEKKFNLTDIAARISQYEDQELDEEGIIQLFQDLIDSRFICSLQGSYQRTAAALIRQGLCV